MDVHGSTNIKSFVVNEVSNYNLDLDTYEEMMVFIRALHTQLNIRWKYLQDTQQKEE
jgi:hypothetical protein